MSQFFVYILQCADNSYYVGQTNNLVKRIDEHNNKTFSGYTSTKHPVKLVFSIMLNTRSQALILEKKIKKWSRQKKLALINGLFKLI